jgi:hypothetical protein
VDGTTACTLLRCTRLEQHGRRPARGTRTFILGEQNIMQLFQFDQLPISKKKYIPSVLSISEANSLMEWNKSLDRTSRQKLQTGRHRLKYSTSPRVGNKLSMTQLKLLSVVIVWSRKECE